MPCCFHFEVVLIFSCVFMPIMSSIRPVSPVADTLPKQISKNSIFSIQKFNSIFNVSSLLHFCICASSYRYLCLRVIILQNIIKALEYPFSSSNDMVSHASYPETRSSFISDILRQIPIRIRRHLLISPYSNKVS